MESSVYLDYNATAPLRPEARTAMAAALDVCGNPSSVHAPGRAARRLVEDAREQVAALVGAAPSQVIFTSGGTEANNMALKGCGRDRIIVSAIEHESVLRPAPDAEIAPVDGDGVVDAERLAARLGRDGPPALVSVMLANNETGAIQPVAEIAALARDHGALVHCDAVQAAGKIAIDMAGLGVDLLTLSAHKLGGPPGTGALIAGDGVTLAPLIAGGGQERGRRAGTENVAGIAGFGAAAEAAAGLGGWPRIAALRDRLEARAGEAVPDLHIFGAAAPRLPNTSCLAMPGVRAETQVMALDLAGVAVSAGSACSSGKVEPSQVLLAMGAGEEAAANAIRVSLGWASESADVDAFLAAWADLHARRTAA